MKDTLTSNCACRRRQAQAERFVCAATGMVRTFTLSAVFPLLHSPAALATKRCARLVKQAVSDVASASVPTVRGAIGAATTSSTPPVRWPTPTAPARADRRGKPQQEQVAKAEPDDSADSA